MDGATKKCKSSCTGLGGEIIGNYCLKQINAGAHEYCDTAGCSVETLDNICQTKLGTGWHLPGDLECCKLKEAGVEFNKRSNITTLQGYGVYWTSGIVRGCYSCPSYNPNGTCNTYMYYSEGDWYPKRQSPMPGCNSDYSGSIRIRVYMDPSTGLAYPGNLYCLRVIN